VNEDGSVAERSQREDSIARDRIVRLFKYVAEYHQMRNPAVRQLSSYDWRLRLADIPDHDSIELLSRVHAEESAEGAEPVDEPSTERILLKCRRPKTTEPPEPPAELDGWLGRDWEDCLIQPEPIPSRNENAAETGETAVVRFTDDGGRVDALLKYRSTWDVWAIAERTTVAAGKVFESLYDLQGRLRRDGERYELIISDGLITWARDDGGITHPVLFRTTRLDFDATVPEFRIVETSATTEFYGSLFRGMPDLSGELIGTLNSDLESMNPHPLGGSDTDAFLTSLASTLASRGTFVGHERNTNEGKYPISSRAPHFIMRQRTMGMARAFDAIVKDAIAGGKLALALCDIVGAPKDSVSIPGLATSGTPEDAGGGVLEDDLLDEQILFTKPANGEQMEIARRLDRETCITVQGPPGTGKSHTIANLIGHLLASGKRVLVTSHTTKALRVLRDKVVPELQPLCLSVLDSAEDDAALKSSIDGIVQRLGGADARHLQRDIRHFASERADLISEIRGLEGAVRDARLGEQLPIVLEGGSIQPIAAAKEVAQGSGAQDWIPSPVSPGAPLPLSRGEFAELYATNAELPAEDEQTLHDPLPELNAMLPPIAFATLVRERQDIANLDIAYRSDLWQAPLEAASADQLETIVAQLQDGLAILEQFEPWALRLAEAGTSLTERGAWETLLTEIAKLRAEAADGLELYLAYAPQLASDIAPDRALEIYEAIAADVKSTGKAPGALTLLARGEWKRAIGGARVADGAKVRLPEHFAALASHARLVQKRDTFRRRWRLQIESIGGPALETLGDDIESGANRMATLISSALNWWQTSLIPAIERSKLSGFRWNAAQAEAETRYAATDQIGRIRRLIEDIVPPAFAAERARRRSSELEAEVKRLRAVAREWPPSQPAALLRRALDILSADSYQSAYSEVERLAIQTGRATTRRTLLKRLERAAPNWADQIRSRVGVHGTPTVPGDVSKAWRWRQLEDELNRRDAISMPDLLRRLDERRVRLHEITGALADRSAWLAQSSRTTPAQRQALMGFATAKKMLGKGKGKGAATFAALARKLMSQAREAVPVWIMPIVKAAEVFDPAETRFDVVIIDEASQCDLNGLLTFYIGRQVIVVGDDEQVSPSAIGESVLDVQHLIEMYLFDIPLKELFNGKLSIYDIAKQSFSTGALRLLEHFRCVPDIIRFSNALSYQGTIKPLREVLPSDPAPAVVAHRVASKGTVGKVNEDEAISVASLVAAAIEQSEYAGKSFGIISMVGDDQAYRVETLVRMIVLPVLIEARALLSGSAAQFQGDERDIMFLSMVDVGEGLPLRLDRQTKPFQQRFNVAASRARDQMWVVYSLDPDTELQSEDIRRRLITHAIDPTALSKLESAAIARVESPFEREVVQRLTNAGYRVRTQHSVGAYRIDIVVEGLRDRLAVECDGDRYHRLEDLQKDIERQQILERLKWKFVRIRGSRFYRDREAAMAPVFERLRELEIHPLDFTPAKDENVGVGDLVSRVRSRAADIEADLRDRITYSPFVRRRRSSRFGRSAPNTENAEGRTTTESAATHASRRSSIRRTVEPSIQIALSAEVEEENAVGTVPLDNRSAGQIPLESDILQSTMVILASGETMERERFLRAIAANLRQPLNHKLRSTLNRMISQEVQSGKLRVDALWSSVSRP
jgi:very-short-patch-repair endonuclease